MTLVLAFNAPEVLVTVSSAANTGRVNQGVLCVTPDTQVD